ncbi:MAG: ATP synthase F1 subunit gamma [Bryobacteraceae bacterium]|nr:ATP synthase F1 subunit gamma [Bryobacteraceae bacterium]MDW8378790.1 ATP synthase F1 subunit gamma [Bryobacterales bacterium]
MPSLIDLRRRIRSVKNTQQITKAMKMVAAAKLRRAQERVIAARPFANSYTKLLANIVAAAAGDERVSSHPLLAVRPENRIRLILITADRGYAGAFNANLIRGAQSFLEERKAARLELEAVGRKGRDFFKRRHVPLSGEHIGIVDKAPFAEADKIAKSAMARFASQELDAVYLLYNEFRSVISQKLTIKRILPVPVPDAQLTSDYIYEQPPDQLLSNLLPHYVSIMVYAAMLESAAAEQAARMVAMDAATSNAAKMIDSLTLHLNRVRQASITKEIIEVVSGAAALE